MIFQSVEDYKPILNKFVQSIITNIDLSQFTQQNNKNTSLEQKLINGTITYSGFYFKGYFTNEIKQELKKIGATQNNIGFYLPVSKLPQNIKNIITKNKNRVNFVKNDIAEYLASLSVMTLISFELLNNFTNIFFKKTNLRNGNIFTSNITQILTQQVKTTLSDIALFISTHDFPNVPTLLNTLKVQINYYIKEKVLNIVAQEMFKVQADACKEKGYMSFYWWHVPAKKQGDRMFHRKHFEDSKKGKKFYFNNLPTHDGQPDYPGKLWNCRCRAYVNENEFKKNI